MLFLGTGEIVTIFVVTSLIMIIIRRATLYDAEIVATHLLFAMQDIVYGFIGRKDYDEAAAFMFYFTQKENNQYAYTNCWVAEVDHQVVAVANVYDGATMSTLRQPVIDYIGKRFERNFEPEDETGPGEFYIDSLGVTPDQRGKGIGSNVLQFLIGEYVTRGRQALGLLVEENNPEARKLYVKMGFKPAGKKILFGKNMEHLQIQFSGIMI